MSPVHSTTRDTSHVHEPRWTLRTVATLACAAAATACTVVVVGARVQDGRPTPLVDAILHRWAKAWLAPAGVRLRVEGLERVDQSRQYIVVSNHQSNLDPIVHLIAIPVPVRFLAMREIFDIPLLGGVLRNIGMIEVDRARPDGRAITRGVARALERGSSVMVYPEGGTSDDGTVGGFHSGAFVIAISQSLPILPVATFGTRSVWRPGSNAIRGGQVRVTIGEPVETGSLTLRDADRLRGSIREWIVDAYQALGG